MDSQYTILFNKFLQQQQQDKLAQQKAAEEASKAELGSAGIKSGATLITGLLGDAAQRALNAASMQQKAQEALTESQVKGIQSAQENQQNALARLMANFRSAI